MGNKIISVDWLKPNQIWVCDDCEVISPKVRLLTLDARGYLNIEYYCGYAEEDTNHWCLLDPDSRDYTWDLIGLFRKSVTCEYGDPGEWLKELKWAQAQGLFVPEGFYELRKLIDGEIVHFDKTIFTPIGEWVTEKNIPEGCGWDGEDWFLLKDIKKSQDGSLSTLC